LLILSGEFDRSDLGCETDGDLARLSSCPRPFRAGERERERERDADAERDRRRRRRSSGDRDLDLDRLRARFDSGDRDRTEALNRTGLGVLMLVGGVDDRR